VASLSSEVFNALLGLKKGHDSGGADAPAQ
jgi:hypothetical protein